MVSLKIVYTSKANYPLTYGKVYEGSYDETATVYSSTGWYYKILDDDNEYRWYYYGHFTFLDEYRSLRIDKIIY